MTLFDDFVPEGSPRRGDLHTARGLIRLLRLPGIGPKRALKLADLMLNWESLASSSSAELAEITKTDGESLLSAIRQSYSEDYDVKDCSVVCCFDEGWPRWLNDLPDPPVLVYFRGTLPPGESLAVVGTRNPTDFGRSVVETVTEECARRGFGVVSGLALGIDAAAHRAALRYGTRTWAILGSGVDVPSPKENIELAEEILESGGGLLSEQPPGTIPSPRTLVARNRLQSAAASAVVAAQCGIPSGTLHTVRFALQQGRKVVVPRPRSPWDLERESAGNMALTDPHGCSPETIGATGALARRLRNRKPLADLVLQHSADVARIWE